MENPETLAKLGTQDTGRKQTKQLNVRENRRGVQVWRIQTLAKLGTQDTGQRPSKQKTIQHNTTQKR
jgi:hypothetical protein